MGTASPPQTHGGAATPGEVWKEEEEEEVKSLPGKPGCPQAWASGAGSPLYQILSPLAPISLGSHSPPCPSLQVHFQGALASSPLQVCRPGVGLPLASTESLRQQEPDPCLFAESVTGWGTSTGRKVQKHSRLSPVPAVTPWMRV